MRKARLICVTSVNNNKYYNMDENADGTVSIEFGRVGASCQTRTILSSQWDSTFKSKVKKGYKDVSHIVMEVVSDSVSFKDISDDHVKMLLDKLQAYQHTQVTANYRVGAGSVTKMQIAEAQALLDGLASVDSIGWDKPYNTILLELFQIIPRKMTKVADHLINFDADASVDERVEQVNKKLQKEQDLLDSMASQVVQTSLAAENKDDSRTMLEAMGVDIARVTPDEVVTIKRELDSLSSKFRDAYRITNRRTQQMFDDYVAKSSNKKTELFFHGSRNENWLSIIKSGLVLRPTNAVVTGKMFGYGTYFADKAQKSYGYTSGRGSYWANGNASEAIMALYDVHVGNQKVLTTAASSLTRKSLDAVFDSVFAKAGSYLRNNEYIVYEEDQSTIKYLVILAG